jgi:hypothetical protein
MCYNQGAMSPADQAWRVGQVWPVDQAWRTGQPEPRAVRGR